MQIPSAWRYRWHVCRQVRRSLSLKDDAAGLAQSMKLDPKITPLDASISNNSNFRSMLQTQDGLAQEIQSALLRMNELAVLYQDITKTAHDKAAYELELNELDVGIFDMAGKTFNGVDLFFTDGKVFTGDDSSSTLNQNNIADGLGRGATGDYKLRLSSRQIQPEPRSKANTSHF